MSMNVQIKYLGMMGNNMYKKNTITKTIRKIDAISTWRFVCD